MKYIILFTATLILFACQDKNKEVDISEVKLDIETTRFDELLTSDFEESSWQDFKDENPVFANQFAENVLGVESSTAWSSMVEFRNYFDSIGIINTVKTEFASFPEEKDYEKLQKRLVAMFPSHDPVPLTTMISGFNFKNMLLDDQLGLGLELYLGDEFDYTKLGSLINEYQLHRFHRDYIVPDAATAIIDDFYEDRGEYNTFLKRIIYEGKKLYLKELLLTESDPSTFIGLTPEDYEWCENNEQMIWRYIVSEELLYSFDIQRWKTYVFDGPFSAGMPENAPALTGNYIGWQIIKSYIKNNPDISVRELLENEDATAIFNASRYAP